MSLKENLKVTIIGQHLFRLHDFGFINKPIYMKFGLVNVVSNGWSSFAFPP